ncbi:trypsin-like peptidase domain-containing protein [Streptomyces sp. NBC_00076]|uniref:trypsin-like peptidase domain-containing protein n=1 Tax=Streptomyces sp. NBC_00076 TaxID=2975642 RepID=UPI00325315FC
MSRSRRAERQEPLAPIPRQGTTTGGFDVPGGRREGHLHRVVAVSPCLPEGAGIHASGLRISSTLILTVAHVLTVGRQTARRARIFLADQPGQDYEAEVVWNSRRPADAGQDRGLDAAVLRLVKPDAEGLSSLPPVRWGEYTLPGRHRVTGVGFPGFEVRRRTTAPRTVTGVIDVVREPWQRVFMLERDDGDARLTTGLWRADGLSGTVLHSEDRSLVIGVVFQHDRQDSRLAVMPAPRLLENRKLSAWIASDAGDPHVAPVKLDGLLVQPPAPARTPAALLDPARRLLPLSESAVGGVKDLADHLLLQEGRVALLHGAAHSGKTRMAHELIAMMRSKGWNAGFLARTPRPDHDWHDVLPRLDRSTLLVVDELETRPAQWKALRKWVTDDRSGHVSLLGIARSPRQEDGTTTTQVQTSDATATPSQLTHLLKEPLRQITEGPAGVRFADTEDIDATVSGQGNRPQKIAIAQAWALSALLRRSSAWSDPGEPYRVLLAHEHRYAAQALRAGLPWLDDDLCQALLTACAYFDASAPAETVDDVRITLEHHLAAVRGFDLSNPTFLDAMFLHSIAEALAELYPPTDGAHRSRMPEAVRQAQDDHASAYRPNLGPLLLRAAPAHRRPQYEALRSSADRVPPAYGARARLRGGPDDPQPSPPESRAGTTPRADRASPASGARDRWRRRSDGRQPSPPDSPGTISLPHVRGDRDAPPPKPRSTGDRGEPRPPGFYR